MRHYLLLAICSAILPGFLHAQGTLKDFFPLYDGMTREYTMQSSKGSYIVTSSGNSDSFTGVATLTILRHETRSDGIYWRIIKKHNGTRSVKEWHGQTTTIDTAYIYIGQDSIWLVESEDGMHEIRTNSWNTTTMCYTPWPFPLTCQDATLKIFRYSDTTATQLSLSNGQYGSIWSNRVHMIQNFGIDQVHTDFSTPTNSHWSNNLHATLIGPAVDTTWLRLLQVDTLRCDAIERGFGLEQNYPNPVSRTMTIGYSLPADEKITLRINDLYGREVAALIDDVRSAGRHSERFEIGTLPSGIYLYRLEAGGKMMTRMVSVVK
jgi:hypothetical protein